MRQFLLGANVAYASGSDLSEVANGAVGFFYNDDGELAVATSGDDIKKECMLVLGRDAKKGGPVVIPIFKNNFSYVKGEYEASTTFEAKITIPAPTHVGDYSVIVVLKGTKFNERNKWTAMIHVHDTDMTSDELAKKIAEQINNMTVGSGVVATVSGSDITITAKNAGVDYEIVPADTLWGTEVTVSSQGIPAYGDVNYVQDLADKAAADAGFEYTFRDAYYYLYPNYPINPLKQDDTEDTGFTIFTLRFAEPRDVKTRDEVVNQIVQVAFPTGAAAISTFETVCAGLAGEKSSSGTSTASVSDTTNDSSDNNSTNINTDTEC